MDCVAVSVNKGYLNQPSSCQSGRLVLSLVKTIMKRLLNLNNVWECGRRVDVHFIGVLSNQVHDSVGQ